MLYSLDHSTTLNSDSAIDLDKQGKIDQIRFRIFLIAAAINFQIRILIAAAMGQRYENSALLSAYVAIPIWGYPLPTHRGSYVCDRWI